MSLQRHRAGCAKDDSCHPGDDVVRCAVQTALLAPPSLCVEPVASPTKRQKTAAATAAAAERELSERIESNMNELVKLSDEKLNIATQVRAKQGVGVGAAAGATPSLEPGWTGVGWTRCRAAWQQQSVSHVPVCVQHCALPRCAICITQSAPVYSTALSSGCSNHLPLLACRLRQVYDYIDRHITKLDKDCKAFDAGAWGSSSGLAAWHMTAAAAAGLEAAEVVVPHATSNTPCSAPRSPFPSLPPHHITEIGKERQRLGMPPAEPTIGGGSMDTSGGGKRKRKVGESAAAVAHRCCCKVCTGRAGATKGRLARCVISATMRLQHGLPSVCPTHAILCLLQEGEARKLTIEEQYQVGGWVGGQGGALGHTSRRPPQLTFPARTAPRRPRRCLPPRLLIFCVPSRAPRVSQAAVALADPSEPKYCHCQRISFGEMIACENPGVGGVGGCAGLLGFSRTLLRSFGLPTQCLPPSPSSAHPTLRCCASCLSCIAPFK